LVFDVTILGSSSATPIIGRFPTAQFVRHNAHAALFDCGEGAQARMLQFRCKMMRIAHIFISHLHGDHIYGLMGLLSTMALNGRTEPVHLVGPIGLRELILCSLEITRQELPYFLTFQDLEPAFEGFVCNTPGYAVHAFPVDHGIPCFAFVLETHPRKRRLNKAALDGVGASLADYAAISAGHDWVDGEGKLHLNEDLTKPPSPPLKYVYITDTLPLPQLPSIAQNADLMYHEATFCSDRIENALATHHSTALQAASIAFQANAKKLIIGHFSARYTDLNEHLAEAQRVFPNTELALEGVRFNIAH